MKNFLDDLVLGSPANHTPGYSGSLPVRIEHRSKKGARLVEEAAEDMTYHKAYRTGKPHK